jgi:hypothetical protein
MLEGRKRILLIVRKPRKEIEMESDTKFFVAIFGVLSSIFLGMFGYLTYSLHLRTEYINGSSDPIAAACAYDSQEAAFPPSCVAHLYQQKETLNALQ